VTGPTVFLRPDGQIVNPITLTVRMLALN